MVSVEFSAEIPERLWIPPGFAHGFLVLSQSADMLYKTTDLSSPVSELTVPRNDPLAIEWPSTVEPALYQTELSDSATHCRIQQHPGLRIAVLAFAIAKILKSSPGLHIVVLPGEPTVLR